MRPGRGGMAKIWQLPRVGAAAASFSHVQLQPWPLWNQPVVLAKKWFFAGGKINSGQVPGEGRVRSSLWPGSLLKDSRVGWAVRPGCYHSLLRETAI